jgi:capsular polysaccharide biosynthesis protein
MDNNSGLSRTTETTEDEYVFSIGDFLRAVWRRFWVVVLVALSLSGVVVGRDLVQHPVYEASAQIMVGQEQSRGVPGTLEGQIGGLEALAGTAVEAVHSRRVAEDVIQKLDLKTTPESLLSGLTVEQVTDTQFIWIRYRGPNPAEAQEIANAVAVASSDQISEVSPSAGIKIVVWEPATRPEAPVSPNPMRSGIMALVLGLILGIGLALLLDYLDHRWRSPEEVERVTGVPTLGVVPKFESPKAKNERGT